MRSPGYAIGFDGDVSLGYSANAGFPVSAASDYAIKGLDPDYMAPKLPDGGGDNPNARGDYHTDLQTNVAGAMWNNRLAYWGGNANSSPLSAPVTPASGRQWSKLVKDDVGTGVPARAFRSGQDYMYGLQVDQEFLGARSEFTNGSNAIRFTEDSIAQDVIVGRPWSHALFNRNVGGPFTIDSTGVITKRTPLAYSDSLWSLPFVHTDVGGLPAKVDGDLDAGRKRVNDAVYVAGDFDHYLTYWPSFVNTGGADGGRTTMPESARGAGWENGWDPSTVVHKWFAPQGDPVQIRTRQGDILSRNGRYQIAGLSRSPSSSGGVATLKTGGLNVCSKNQSIKVNYGRNNPFH